MSLLSACMIVKNEEKFLRQCWDALKNHCDELVIGDSGSTDGTKQIIADMVAEGGPCRVVAYDYEWTGDFSAARNIGLEKATGEWIFSIDGDEVVIPADLEALKRFLPKVIEDAIAVDVIGAYQMKGPSGVMQWELGARSVQPRFFRKSAGVQWQGKVHNLAVYKSDKPAFRDTLRIIHFGYDNEVVGEKGKLDRVCSMCRQQTVETPGDPECWFNLAVALKSDGKSFIPEHADEMLAALDRAIQLSGGELYAVEETGEKQADYYNGLFEPGYDTARYLPMYEQVKEMVKDEKYVLELGCGTGDLAAMIAKEGRLYRGVDFSETGIKQARTKVDKSIGTFMLENLYNPIVYEGDWSCVVALEVLEHVDDLRILNSIPVGRRVIFSVPNFTDPAHLRTYDEEYIADRFSLILKVHSVHIYGAGEAKMFLIDAERVANIFNYVLVQSYNLRGWVHYWRKNYKPAIENAIYSLRLKANYLDPMFLLGVAFADTANYDPAVAWLWRYLNVQRRDCMNIEFDGVTVVHANDRELVYTVLADIERLRNQAETEMIFKSLKGDVDVEATPALGVGADSQPG